MICCRCFDLIHPKGVGFNAKKVRVLRQVNKRKVWETIVRIEVYSSQSDIIGLRLAHSDCIEEWSEQLEEEIANQ